MSWPKALLGDVCEIKIGRTPPRGERRYWGAGHPWLSIADMNQGRDLRSTKEQITEAAASKVMGQPIPAGTIMLSFKLSIGKVGISVVPLYTNEAIASLPIRSTASLLPEFLYWALRSMDFSNDTDRAAMGQTLNKAKLNQIAVPVPPIEEQRRIADILDRADTLRAKRREALAHLDDLTQSIFLDMFGDVRSSLPAVALGELLSSPLRNGLSPATAGTIKGSVLTLSAITGRQFDASARKEASFARSPADDQMVRSTDLLICRGNGNRSLVGRGLFPTFDMKETAFPDTVIAAQLALARIDRLYLQYVWNSQAVREQIESMARTTNGTYKVNQAMLERVELPDPGIDGQRRFGDRAACIEALRQDQQSYLSHANEMFASLQQRAFDGQL